MDDLNLSIIVAQVINFGIIFFLFKYFLGDKIVKVIEDRRAKIKNLEKSDDLVKEKIANAEEEAKAILEKSRKDAQELQEKSEQLIKRNTEIKLSQADEKAQAILDSASRDIEKERGAMIGGMKEKVIDLSLKINEKVFGDSSKNKEFIEKEAASVKI